MTIEQKEQIRQVIKDYVPASALDRVVSIMVKYGFHLRITRPRNSKLGDYRAPYGHHGHRISVNGNLNNYAFLIVYLHEVAHLVVQEKHGQKVLPHGQEWKHYFRELTLPFLKPEVFPMPLLRVVVDHMRNPKASSTADPILAKALRQYDEGDVALTVDDIPTGTKFRLKNGQEFEKGEMRRTRYKCHDTITGKIYLVSGLAEVFVDGVN